MNSDAKLLAVYDDLSKKIELAKSQVKDGKNGKDGKDGKDAPDYSAQLFATVGSLHASLVKELASIEHKVEVSPTINVEKGVYQFDVERDDNGFIKRVRATPIDQVI